MPIRALIVDDSSVMRKIVERSLAQAGIEMSQVFQAGNGAEALGVLKENRVDLILCDINMPVMDGLEFIKQLPGVENAKNVPVVMITTEGSEAQVVQALLRGASGDTGSLRTHAELPIDRTSNCGRVESGCYRDGGIGGAVVWSAERSLQWTS